MNELQTQVQQLSDAMFVATENDGKIAVITEELTNRVLELTHIVQTLQVELAKQVLAGAEIKADVAQLIGGSSDALLAYAEQARRIAEMQQRIDALERKVWGR